MRPNCNPVFHLNSNVTSAAKRVVTVSASALTFFNDEVTRFFSPHAAGKSVMFLTLLGVPQKRRRVMPE